MGGPLSPALCGTLIYCSTFVCVFPSPPFPAKPNVRYHLLVALAHWALRALLFCSAVSQLAVSSYRPLPPGPRLSCLCPVAGCGFFNPVKELSGGRIEKRKLRDAMGMSRKVLRGERRATQSCCAWSRHSWFWRWCRKVLRHKGAGKEESKYRIVMQGKQNKHDAQ